MTENHFTAFYHSTTGGSLPYGIDVPGVGVTQARNKEEIELMSRELIAVHYNIPIDTVSVDLIEHHRRKTP